MNELNLWRIGIIMIGVAEDARFGPKTCSSVHDYVRENTFAPLARAQREIELLKPLRLDVKMYIGVG